MRSCYPMDLDIDLGSYLLLPDGPGWLRSGSIPEARAAPSQILSNTVHTNRRHEGAQVRRSKYLEICVPVALGRSVSLPIATTFRR